MVRKLVLIFGVVLGFGFSSSTFAQLIAYDSFEDAIYSDGGPTLDGVALQLTGPEADLGNPHVHPGWSNEVASESGPPMRKWIVNGGTDSFRYDLVTLSHPAVTYDNSSTGKVEFEAYDDAFNSDFRLIRRVIDDYEPSNTYYMSFLVRTSSLATGALGQRGQALVGFLGRVSDNSMAAAYNNQIDAPTMFGLMIGFDGRGNDQRITDLILRARQTVEGNPTPQFTNSLLLAGEIANPAAPADQQVSTLENLTHLILLKLEVNADADKDLVTYWVNPTDVSNESLATSTAQATGVIETLAIDVNDRLTRLVSTVNRYEDRTFYFDEPRFGYDFYSVAGVDAPIFIGDYNDDDVINAADYVVWRDNLNGAAMLPHDATPGVNDESDYANWRANFGMEAPVGSGAAVTVPEPATVLLLIPLLAGLLVRTKGRARK